MLFLPVPAPDKDFRLPNGPMRLTGQTRSMMTANMWTAIVSKNTYTFKGKKEMLLARHQDPAKLKRIQARQCPTGSRMNAAIRT